MGPWQPDRFSRPGYLSNQCSQDNNEVWPRTRGQSRPWCPPPPQAVLVLSPLAHFSSLPIFAVVVLWAKDSHLIRGITSNRGAYTVYTNTAPVSHNNNTHTSHLRIWLRRNRNHYEGCLIWNKWMNRILQQTDIRVQEFLSWQTFQHV